MSNKKTKTEYRKGTFDEILQSLAQATNSDPRYVRAFIVHNYPQFQDHSKCPNCAASMAAYDFTIDYLTAQLIVLMGDVVKEKIRKGLSFKDANKIHVVTETKGNYAVRSRTTWASKLGLIAKVMKKDGEKLKHDTKAGWLITKRGFDFLRGERVPRVVTVFRNEITERHEETISIDEALRGSGVQHSRQDWVEIHEYMQGSLFARV